MVRRHRVMCFSVRFVCVCHCFVFVVVVVVVVAFVFVSVCCFIVLFDGCFFVF